MILHPRREFSIAVITTVLFSTASLAMAGDCSMLSYTVDDARIKLKRAANEIKLDEAKAAAGRAKSALWDAAMSAMSCGCHTAYGEFDVATSRARSARDAYDPEGFVDSLNDAIRRFNSAIMYLGDCASEHR